MCEMSGRGGTLFVQQLKAAGVQYIFFNPSTGDTPIFDALVDEPSIWLITGVQEGAVATMADGYARLSGKPGVVIVANVGLPNAMTQMVKSNLRRPAAPRGSAADGQSAIHQHGEKL
jgi:thiamine pyrophosphate-dependent acetolactate synthase large subunit-like protein